MKVLVYLPEEKLAPKGGPLAVGYYYHEEMKRRGENTLDFIHVNEDYEEIHAKGRRITSQFPKWLNNIHRTIRSIINRRKFLSGMSFAPKKDLSKYDIIHFHSSFDLYMERNNLEGYKGIVLYQSHSPIPTGQEVCKDLPLIYNLCIPRMLEKYEVIDRYALDRADYIIFPCAEAEEPYCDNWKYFKEFKAKNKGKFKYVLTGIMPSYTKIGRDSILRAYEIPSDSFVISYVGRHNTVKGYDKLKEIAQKYFEVDKQAWVISAGLESPFSRLRHPRWKEIGFTDDPHSLIAASDVFILPNRVTYFDIVMIEVLSLGKIVLASRTGGNKYFEKQGLKGVILYDDTKDAIDKLSQIRRMPKEERIRLGEGNRMFYNKHLSNVAMYDRFMSLLKTLNNKI